MSIRTPVWRVAVSLGLLLALGWWLDVGALAARLAGMRPGWVALALAISLAQVAVLAWRWCYTARCLGVDLSFSAAWREYYLSIFLNQVLPGGVMGDVSRVWRQAHAHRGGSGTSGPAMRAVVFERVSAQAVMTSVAVISLLLLPVTIDRGPGRLLLAGAAAAAALALAAVIRVRRQSPAGGAVARVLDELAAAHLTATAFAWQLASAMFVVATYLLTYLAAARAVGVETPAVVFLPLVAPVLMTMLIPVTVAGWGLRESAAALLWSAVGLSAVDGVTVSVAYGLIVLLGSLPGVIVLVRDR